MNRQGDLAALVSPELAEALEAAHRTLSGLPEVEPQNVSVQLGRLYSEEWVIRATVFVRADHFAAEGKTFSEVVNNITKRLTDGAAQREHRIAKIKAEAAELGLQVREVRR